MSSTESGRLAMPAGARMFPFSMMRTSAERRRAKQQALAGRAPAREAAEPAPSAPPTPDTLKVRKRKDGWALMVDDLEVPAWIVSTKRRAVDWAEDAARHHACTLQVFKADGTLQAEHQYAS